jgi:uncharacterized protein
MLTIDERDALAVALGKAIRTGDVETLQRLLGERPELANARIVDAKGVARPLLHVAADWPGHFPNGPRTVAALIAAGADPDASMAGPRGSAETALHWAASSDDVGVLDALLDGGADIEAPGAIFTGGAPMSDAVIFGQWRAARRLLERGAATNLSQAAALGLLDRVRQLAADTSPSRDELTNALWHACHGGQLDVARALVERGADINWIGHDHKTPLDIALESQADDLVAWLRGAGAIAARGAP